jgi:hypothetical protein
MNTTGLNRVLIVKLGALGDIVHAIPVAAALRRARPSVRIDWLVSPKHRAIVDLVPVIDRRLEMTDARMPGVIRELRRSRYDVALDLQGLIKSAFLARASGARRVIGFSSRYSREPLARLFYTEVHDPGGGGMYHEDETHVVLTNLGLLEPLGIHPNAAPPEFPIDVVDSDVANRVAESTGGRYAIINVGAAWPNKRWLPARFAAVASALRALGAGRGAAGSRGGGPFPGGGDAAAADIDCRHRGARARRLALRDGRHGSRAHRRRRRHAHRRHLRSDTPVAQRSLVERRCDRVARRRLPVSSSPRVPAEDDVSRGHSGGRGDGGHRTPIGGSAS